MDIIINRDTLDALVLSAITRLCPRSCYRGHGIAPRRSVGLEEVAEIVDKELAKLPWHVCLKEKSDKVSLLSKEEK